MESQELAPGDAEHAVLKLDGDLDFRSAPEVKHALLQALTRRRDGLSVDMGSVGFVDSSGLAALFEAAKLARKVQARIRLLRVRRNVRRLLSVCGFIQYFDVEPCREPPLAPEAPGQAAPVSPDCGYLEVPGEAASVPLIRRRIEEVARAMGFRESALRDLLIAVSEAATNAMKHGSPQGQQSTIRVRFQPDGDRLIVEVTDEGPGFDPLAVPVPVAEQMREGGMGVFFIRTLMDEVSFIPEDHGITVQMIKYL
jgi:serine/threonine-protein kinase RsbW